MNPQGTAVSQLSTQSLKSLGIVHPPDWQMPQGGAGRQFTNAFRPEDRNTQSDPARVFRSASSNKFHTDSARVISEKLEAFLDKMSKAVATGWGMWMTSSMVAGVMVNGPVAVFSPGCLQGPPMTGLILSAGAPMSTPNESRYTVAIAKAIGTSWQSWHLGLTGTLSYPPCAVFPGPVAAGIPNIPIPVAALSSPGESMLKKSALSSLMMANYGAPDHAYASEIFDSMADAFDQTFTTWKTSTILTNVLATGAVPTWSPAWMPVAPVVGGVGMGASCLV